MSGAAATTSAGSSGAPYQSHTPGPTRSRNTRANGSLISGSPLSVSAARAAATPSAVAPTLSVISQLSSSVLATSFSYVKPLPVGKAFDGFDGRCGGDGRRRGPGGV